MTPYLSFSWSKVMVKKTLTCFLLLVICLTVLIPLVSGMVNSVQSHPTGDWWSGATDSGRDNALLWAREVEGILEGTTTGQLLAVEEVTAQTNVLTAIECGTTYQITYNGTHTTTLPDAAKCLFYTFIDASATAGYDVVVDCQSGDNIDGATNGNYINSVTDALPATVTLIGINSTDWHIFHESGTWGTQ